MDWLQVDGSAGLIADASRRAMEYAPEETEAALRARAEFEVGLLRGAMRAMATERDTATTPRVRGTERLVEVECNDSEFQVLMDTDSDGGFECIGIYVRGVAVGMFLSADADAMIVDLAHKELDRQFAQESEDDAVDAAMREEA